MMDRFVTAMRRRTAGLIALAVLATAAQPHAALADNHEPEPDAFARPKYQGLRFNEDWSGLRGRDQSQTGDLFDPIKYIELSDDGWAWVSFGGHMRLRLEEWNNFGFAGANDGTFLLTRIALHGDLHLGEQLRIFVEGKSAMSTTRSLPGGRRGLDVDELELQQAFVDLDIPIDDGVQLTIRVGRQALLFGKERLVSPLPWSNTMRTWDGASAIMKVAGWTLHGFGTQFVPVDKYDFNKADGGNEFFGVYATGHVPGVEPVKMDLYWLGLERDTAAIPGGGFNGTTGFEERHTLGGRLFGVVPETGIDYDLEGAFQVGEVGTQDIRAFMVAAEVGVTFTEDQYIPFRWHLGFDYASGDNSPGGDVETFNHLFPLGHAYFGYIDAIGRQNIIDVSTGIKFHPIEKLLVKLTGHVFWRADAADAVYNAGGGVLRAPTSLSKEVGSEIDLLMKYPLCPHLTGTFGYSHFFADNFLQNTGSSADVDFVYLILQYTF